MFSDDLTLKMKQKKVYTDMNVYKSVEVQVK